ncbi:MAG: hypothetical protein CL843_01225 [Crocinitomicaceae bacterium]|nr:hypothetical protein [Crocinitomicaceae bacterium]
MASIGVSLIKLLSRLPFWVLYGFSDLCYVLIYKVFGYRKKVVEQNLRKAFPEKSDAEILAIMHEFYHHLFDMIVETVKGYSISEEELKKRMVFHNLELIEEYYAKGQSLLFMLGHYGNWEYAGISMNLNTQYHLNFVYKTLHNKPFDQLMKSIRGRLGAQLVPMESTFREIIRQRKTKTSITALISDQTPSSKRGYWMEFLHQNTPVFMGGERIAKGTGYPVIHCDARKVKRGHYEVTYSLITEDPKNEPHGMILETFNKRLEERIQKEPAYWLWSHRRWKHKMPENLPEEQISKRFPPSRA